MIKPFTPVELLRSIHKAIDCETGFVGSVHGLSLIDVAQMFHMAQRSVTIVVSAAGQSASKIHFRRGEIVGASHGEQFGASRCGRSWPPPPGRCTPPASRTGSRRPSTRPSITCCWPA
nr:DUF4388 domain-containing protein [Nannocystis pusilla]